MTIHLPTYDTLTRAESGLTDTEWTDLRAYIDMIQDALRTVGTETRRVETVEENPPQITASEFRPGGWIGQYPNDIEVRPSRLTDNEYQHLQRETRKWIETIGATSIAATMPLQADVAIDKRTRLATYSRALIDYTESVRAHRLPVTVNRTRNRGTNPTGRPLLHATIQEEARGSQHIVSESVQFTFDSLQNLLLTRFHADLLGSMQTLADAYTYYDTAFTTQLSYHANFLDHPVVSQLVTQALATDFTAPSVLQRVKRAATNDMQDIVDLWEAYQRDIGMTLEWTGAITTAVKPVSKAYELWCLALLLRLLEDITGHPPRQDHTIETKYEFGDDTALYYTRGFRTHSQYLLDQFNVQPGQPDFALELNGTLRWIGDAKYSDWPLRLSDYQRFITYLVDLLPPDTTYTTNHPVATILYLDTEKDKRNNTIDKYEIEHLSVRPTTDHSSLRHTLTSIYDQA